MASRVFGQKIKNSGKKGIWITGFRDALQYNEKRDIY
jgi:hypothetical protein